MEAKRTQHVISAKEFECFLEFDAVGVVHKVGTGATFQANVTGTTDDIGAFSTNEPIATDNGGTTYDITLTLQEAEANAIKDAVSAALVLAGQPPIAHIRQIVEGLSISAVWNKTRNVPKQITTETYERCTGVEESDNVERRSSETLKTWRFRAIGMSRRTEEVQI